MFFLAFIGWLVLFPITAYQLYRQQYQSFYLFAAGMLIYIVAVVGVTIFCNVPLKEQLAKFPLSTANENEIALMRTKFENPWNTFHSIRTVAAIISFGQVILFLLKQNNWL